MQLMLCYVVVICIQRHIVGVDMQCSLQPAPDWE